MSEDRPSVSSDELIRRAKESLKSPPTADSRQSTEVEVPEDASESTGAPGGDERRRSRVGGRPPEPPVRRSPRPVPQPSVPVGAPRRTVSAAAVILVVLLGVGFGIFALTRSSEESNSISRTEVVVQGEAPLDDSAPDAAAVSRDVPKDDDWQQYCTTDGAPTHVSSTWMANDFVLDGRWGGPQEWSETEFVFLPLQPGWGDPQRYEPCTTYMTAWFMNDDTWLYGLYYVAWDGPTDPDDSGGIALFRGTACCGVESDFGTLPNSTLSEFDGPWDAYGWDSHGEWLGDLDASPPGTTDIEGAGSYDGSGYWFEWRKRLDSGDRTDWILEPGQTVGNAATQTWFLANLWDNSEQRTYNHSLTMTLSTAPG